MVSAVKQIGHDVSEAVTYVLALLAQDTSGARSWRGAALRTRSLVRLTGRITTRPQGKIPAFGPIMAINRAPLLAAG
jgi:hypothetical protein